MTRLKIALLLSVMFHYSSLSYSQTGPNTDSKVPKSLNFEIYFRALCCDKTTELGADEVYITVLGKSSDGQTYAQREPGPDAHWDMNDGNQPTDNPNGDSHCLTNRVLFSGDVEDGQTWNVNIIVGEEDGGNSLGIQEKAAEILAQIDDPYAQGAGVILTILNHFGLYFEDKDDWMGMIGIKVTNDGGSLSVSWNGKEGIVHSIADPDDPGNPAKMEFRMNHDGSNYVGWFGVR